MRLTAWLAPEAVLQGEVHTAGLPLRQFAVYLDGPDGDHVVQGYGPEAEGRFHIGELPAGTYTLAVRTGMEFKPIFQGTITLKVGEVMTKVIEAAAK